MYFESNSLEEEDEESDFLPKTYGTFKVTQKWDKKSLVLNDGTEKRKTGTVGLGLGRAYIRHGNSLFFILVIILLNIAAQGALSFSDFWLSIW